MSFQEYMPNQIPEQSSIVSPQQVDQHAVSFNQTNHPIVKKNNPLIYLIFGIITTILLGVGAYFVVQLINTPALIKEKVLTTYPVFEAYKKTLGKVTDYMKSDSSGSDSDSIQRNIEKGNSLIKLVSLNSENLTSLVVKMDSPQLTEYKKGLNDYTDKAKHLSSLIEEEVKMGGDYIDSIKKYEKLATNITGVSTYMLSEPQRYVTEVNKIIEDENSIVKNLEKFSYKNNHQKLHEAFLKNYKNEVEFLKNMIAAVENRKDNELITAQKQLVENQQENSKEFNRINDNMHNEVDNINNDLDSIESKIIQEYNRLKAKYNF